MCLIIQSWHASCVEVVFSSPRRWSQSASVSESLDQLSVCSALRLLCMSAVSDRMSFVFERRCKDFCSLGGLTQMKFVPVSLAVLNGDWKFISMCNDRSYRWLNSFVRKFLELCWHFQNGRRFLTTFGAFFDWRCRKSIFPEISMFFYLLRFVSTLFRIVLMFLLQLGIWTNKCLLNHYLKFLVQFK